jgi:hypothetical protein
MSFPTDLIDQPIRHFGYDCRILIQFLLSDISMDLINPEVKTGRLRADVATLRFLFVKIPEA